MCLPLRTVNSIYFGRGEECGASGAFHYLVSRWLLCGGELGVALLKEVNHWTLRFQNAGITLSLWIKMWVELLLQPHACPAPAMLSAIMALD